MCSSPVCIDIFVSFTLSILALQACSQPVNIIFPNTKYLKNFYLVYSLILLGVFLVQNLGSGICIFNCSPFNISMLSMLSDIYVILKYVTQTCMQYSN